MDRRVVEFFQRLPADQLVAGGWSKSILRESMVGLLPAPVIWNREKPHLSPQFAEVWIDRDPVAFLRDLPSDHPIHEYVDVGELIRRVADDPDDDEEWRFRCRGLGLWLDETTTNRDHPGTQGEMHLLS